MYSKGRRTKWERNTLSFLVMDINDVINFEQWHKRTKCDEDMTLGNWIEFELMKNSICDHAVCIVSVQTLSSLIRSFFLPFSILEHAFDVIKLNQMN